MIALGTNDLGQYDTDDEYEAAIKICCRSSRTGTPVAWINAYAVGKADDAARFDAALATVLQRARPGDDRRLGVDRSPTTVC